MTWLRKAINFIKEHVPQETAFHIEVAEDIITEGADQVKLATEMVNAALVNVEVAAEKGFKKILGDPGPPGFNTQEGPTRSTVSVQDLASMASSAYDEGGGQRDKYHNLVNRQVKDLSFTIFESDLDGHLVVSFRGTNSFENWQKRNLDFHKVDDGHGNMVHGGFKSAWDDLKPVVDKELFDIFGSHEFTNNVTFTGHSLGGAIAQLATADYGETQNPRLVDGFTFASPVVGDEGFNKRIKGGHLMNVIDPRDSVPKIVQQLQPDFKENMLARQELALGDRAAQINDKVKKDAIRFGIKLSFDVGTLALLSVLGPELGEAAEVSPEVDEVVLEGGLALEEEAVIAAQESAGLGAAAEEAAGVKAIAGEGLGITTAERAEISVLLNAETRASVIAQLRALDAKTIAENIVLDRLGKVNLELSIARVLTARGIDQSVQNLITPFIVENMKGLEEIDPERISFLIQNSYDFMYGSIVAHPMGTYVKNVDTRFGDTPANAREWMWHNYTENLEEGGENEGELLEFMSPEELFEFKNDFTHQDVFDHKESGTPNIRGRGPLLVDPDDLAEHEKVIEEMDREREEESKQGVLKPKDDDFQVKMHDVSANFGRSVTGRPLQVLVEGQGRKSNGERVYAVVTETGETLSYTGPSHPASTTTLYGKWTGVAPFADAEPMKVSRQNAFGSQAYSALDTFSLAYLVNSYSNGYHNQKADEMYQKRIHMAIDNGFISEAIDGEELRVAKFILQQFEESGHLFGASTASAKKGNMLTEIEMMSRGKLTEVGDDVTGVPVGFSNNAKRKLERMLETPEGTMVARDIMQRDSKRLKSSEVDDVNIMEDSVDTIQFNMMALKALGMSNRPEFSVMLNGAKQNAMAYKTALNVERKISDVIKEVSSKGNPMFAPGPKSIFPNTFSRYTDSETNQTNDANLGGSEEYLVDVAVSNILKSLV